MLRNLDGAELLTFIIERGLRAGDRLPPLEELSAERGISISKLREQLEVARALGLVEVKPRTGIRVCPYSFLPAVRLSLLYALAQDRRLFDAYARCAIMWSSPSSMRQWRCLPPRITPISNRSSSAPLPSFAEDPPRIPHAEHRELHLTSTVA
jgi:Transcriptional regulators